ncbi:MAG: hypothetical protein Q4G58_16880 [bacterium]|nr:hypothetical protein [bacterium]
MKKRIGILSFLFCICMLAMPNVQVKAASFASGMGTVSNPYKIETPAQLNEIRNYSDKHFVLVNDIDLSQDRKTRDWQPIKTFSGSLDGNGYSIKNLYVEQENSSVGLIVEASNATIKNVSLTDVNLSGKNTAGLVVKVPSGSQLTIDGCNVVGTLKGKQVSAGLVAQAYGKVAIRNVSANGTIEGGLLGGIIGEMNEGQVTYATYKGSISKTGYSYYYSLGGIVGQINTNTTNALIDSCDVEATLSNGGGIVGSANGGSIKNCTMQGSINGYGGGILAVSTSFYGEEKNRIQVLNCTNKADITIGGGGGIVGQANDGCTIKNCINYGNVTGRMESGGIAGMLMRNGLVEDCVNYGDMQAFDKDDGTGAAGGIVGRTVDYMSFNDKDTSQVVNSISFGKSVGDYPGTICGVSGVDFMFAGCYYTFDQRPVGRGNSEGTYRVGEVRNPLIHVGTTQSMESIYGKEVSITPLEVKDATIIEISNNKLVGRASGTTVVTFKIEFDWNGNKLYYQNRQSIEVVSNGFAGGQGTHEDPYQVATVEQLELVRSYPNAYYRLENDIDLYSVRSFEPIGSKKAAFTGGFDGNNHVISGLTVTKQTEYAGLFGLVCNATIENIGLEDAYITTGKYAGGIVGYALAANIENCIVNGEIAATSVQNNYAGLIVGYMQDGKLDNSCGVGAVKSAYAGVFAGYIDTVPTNCYWYQPYSNKGVGTGTSQSVNAVKKIDLGINNMTVGDRVGTAVMARATVPTTNFKLYGTPTNYSYKSSSNTKIIKIVNGQLVAVSNGTTMVNVTVSFKNGKSVNLDYQVAVKQQMSKVSVSAITTQMFTNKNITPKIVVKDGNKVLSVNDYSISYSNNRNPGKASVTITGKGNYSGTKTIYFTIQLPKVQTPSYAVSQNTVKLSWKAISGVNGYEVYQYSTKKNTNVKATTLQIGKLASGTAYQYKVRAYKMVAGKKVYGAYSNVVKPVTKLKTPSVSLKAGKGLVTVKWSKTTGAKGYELQMSTKKGSSYKTIKEEKSNAKVSYTKTKLTKGKTYYFRVRAYQVVNGKKVYTGYSSVKSVKVK